jgi:D-methionine transport system ATP-binding protein
MIELQHITRTFHKGGRTVAALSDVSLTVPAGKIFGVIGPSGAGKSTLIRCVNLLETPTSGTVIVDGQHLQRLSRSRLNDDRIIRFVKAYQSPEVEQVAIKEFKGGAIKGW